MTPDEAIEKAYNEVAAEHPEQKFEPFKRDYISYQVSVRAMEEYAKQEAMSFLVSLGQDSPQLAEIMWKVYLKSKEGK